MPYPTARKLFVVSDLHLGGRPDERDADGRVVRTGFQICDAYAELVAMVDWVASQHTEARPAELVIAGDVVDFLADDDPGDGALPAEPWTESDAHAVSKTERAFDRVRDDGGRGIVDALRDLLARGAALTILLGNHDVELGLPAVRRWLVEALGGQGRRLQLIYDGEAYAAGRVLVEHGNRYDVWNQIDHSRLRQERSHRSRGLAVDPSLRDRLFVAPAGTHLVIDFMNGLKRKYRFIDLLKPETGAVVPLLLALEPDLRPALKQLLALVPIGRHIAAHGVDSPLITSSAGDMGGEVDAPGLDAVLYDALGEDAALFVEEADATVAGDMGGVASLRAALAALSDSAARIIAGARSAWNLLALRNEGDGPARLLRLHAALRPLARPAPDGDRSFDLGHEAAPYLDAARALVDGDAFDVVVFGHTHLPKQIRIDRPGREPGLYLNTGTWASVMRLPPALDAEIDDALPELERFVSALGTGSFEPYVRRYLTYAEIDLSADGVATATALRSFCGRDAPREAPLRDAPREGARA